MQDVWRTVCAGWPRDIQASVTQRWRIHSEAELGILESMTCHLQLCKPGAFTSQLCADPKEKLQSMYWRSEDKFYSSRGTIKVTQNPQQWESAAQHRGWAQLSRLLSQIGACSQRPEFGVGRWKIAMGKHQWGRGWWIDRQTVILVEDKLR